MKTFTFGLTPEATILQALGDNPYSMTLAKSDAKALQAVVNEGIDSYLAAITDSHFSVVGGKLVCQVAPKDMLIILRRLYEKGDETSWSLRSGILTTLGIEEI